MKRFLPLTLLAAALIVAAPALADDAKEPAKKEPVKKVQLKDVQIKKIQIQLQPNVAFFSVVTTSSVSNPITLVRMPQVKAEIKLTDEQDAKIQEAFQNLSQKRRGLYAGLGKIPAQERAKKIAELQKKYQAQQNETYVAIKKSLKPEQVERLEQLAIQRQGVRALSTNEVVKKLKLTKEQQEKVATAFTKQTAQLRQLSLEMRNQQIDRNEYQEKRLEVQKAIEKKIMVEILTMAQQTRFDQMKGKAFDFGNRNGLGVQLNAIQIQVRPLQLKKLEDK